MRAVRPHLETEESLAPSRLLVGLQHEGAGAVAEDDGAVALRGAPGAGVGGSGRVRLAEEDGPLRLGPGEEGRVAFGPDEQDAAVRRPNG